ncbi:protein PHYTOCHROME KINASE SUBSTRATE 4-like [Typha latifolia]|uniref:protein PHYTOCHROME KINASE SUBSTRATE 4-like n=1 Tax=Typha latifolia TaxID=4733 RepID=UPI003C2FA372
MERYRSTQSFNRSLYSNGRPPLHSNPSPFLSLPPKPHLREPPISSPSARRSHDTELSIFDAERYFRDGQDPSERCDLSTANPRDSSVSSIDGYGRSTRNGVFATPTASSEASWNSRSGLLSNPPGSAAIKVRTFPSKDKTKMPSSPGRRIFSRNCPCAGKKSVDVEERYEPKSPACSNLVGANNGFVVKEQLGFIPREMKHELETGEITKVKITPGLSAKDANYFGNSTLFSPKKPPFSMEMTQQIVKSRKPANNPSGFSFPVLKPTAKTSKEDPPRDSLEVFHPRDEPAVLRKSMQRLTFSGDDDVASDASSDLFEIESFSTSYPASYRHRDSLEETSTSRFGAGFRRSVAESAASEVYPPSEVSVEWSVTTAEGCFDRNSVANFSSSASDFGGEFRFIQSEHDRFAAAMASDGATRRGSSGSMLGCGCEEAVSVRPNSVRFVPDKHRPVYSVEPDRVTKLAKLGRPVQTR